MSNAREHETSPFTTEQNQRAEAVACAVAALNQVQHDECVAAFEVVELADYIHTGQLGPHHTPPPVVAEFVGDAPEPSSATVTEATECQWPGCDRVTHRLATFKVDQHSAVHAYDACDLHRGRRLVERMP